LQALLIRIIRQVTTFEVLFPCYLGKEKHPFLKKRLILDLFKDVDDYQGFVFNQADYQRSLEEIKHLIWEK